MLNKVMLIGRLWEGSELRYSQGGMPIGNLNVATDENYTGSRDGNRVEKTEWHRVVVLTGWLKTATIILQRAVLFMLRAPRRHANGRIKQGQDRYTTENPRARTVRFLDKKGDRLTSHKAEKIEAIMRRLNTQGQDRIPSTPVRNSPQRQPEAEDLGPAFPIRGIRDG